MKKHILYIVVATGILSIFSTSSTFAENVDYNVNIAPALTLTTSTNSLALNLDPSSKIFDSKDLTVTVGTNNATGYKLTLSTPNDNTDLERDTSGDTTAISATIPTLDTGTYTESTFTANKWGYSINSNTAIPSTVTSGFIPFVSGNTLMERDTAINHDEAELSFASKIDYLQPAGTYNTTLQFNIVANPPVGYLQNWTGCPTMEAGDTTTLIDSRDNEEYLVGKLADGNCWLLENLRLDISDPTVQAKLDSTTTNASDETLGYLINGGGSSPYPANGVIAKTASSGSWLDSWNNPYIGTQYKATVQPASGSIPAGKIGVYYNFCAASAGSYCYANGAGIGNANYDICPNGWRMPTSGTGGEYSNLLVAYNNNQANLIKALSTPLAGFFYAGSVRSRGTSSGFWASSRYNTANMYYLYINSNATAQPGQTLARYYGFPIRCILK